MNLIISLSDIDPMKARLIEALPHVKSSHRVEALARGLGWRTNAAMRADLAQAPRSVTANGEAFRSYLEEHGFTADPDLVERALARAGIRRAMDAEPTLTMFGYNVRDRKLSPEEHVARFTEWRKGMLTPGSEDEFLHAVGFLSRYGKRKTINKNASSYGLKHQAERFDHKYGSRGYVANGMLMAAALALGFTLRQCDWNSPNAWLNISSRLQGSDRAAA